MLNHRAKRSVFGFAIVAVLLAGSQAKADFGIPVWDETVTGLTSSSYGEALGSAYTNAIARAHFVMDGLQGQGYHLMDYQIYDATASFDPWTWTWTAKARFVITSQSPPSGGGQAGGPGGPPAP